MIETFSERFAQGYDEIEVLQGNQNHREIGGDQDVETCELCLKQADLCHDEVDEGEMGTRV